MLSLRETQTALTAAIRSDEPASSEARALESLIIAAGIEPGERIRIYRNNHRSGASSTMQATYPVIERLGGADWFAQSVAQYQQRHPSRCGDLQYLGEEYPSFLRADLAGTSHAYFSDVARLEWAYQLALTAEEREPVDLAVLGAVAPRDYDRLVFVPRPSVRLVESEYPIFAIWHANQPSATPAGELRLDAGPSRVLLIRRKDHVELRELSEGSSRLLRQCQLGAPLGAAAEAAAQAAEFDLQSSLRELLGLETIAEIVCADAREQG